MDTCVNNGKTLSASCWLLLDKVFYANSIGPRPPLIVQRTKVLYLATNPVLCQNCFFKTKRGKNVEPKLITFIKILARLFLATVNPIGNFLLPHHQIKKGVPGGNWAQEGTAHPSLPKDESRNNFTLFPFVPKPMAPRPNEATVQYIVFVQCTIGLIWIAANLDTAVTIIPCLEEW